MRPLDRPVGPLARIPAILGIGLAALLLGAAAAGAQGEGSLRFEKTVPWQTGKRIPLGATVGPVRVGSVTFDNLGRGGGAGGGAAGIVGRLRPGGASDTQTTLRASFDSENPKAEE